MLPEEKEIRCVILRKMFKYGYIGGRHTSLDNLQKGFPGHLKGSVKVVAKDIIKEGLIISHPTSYGVQIALNPQRIREVEKEIN